MLEPGNNDQLPPIPGKRYFTIGEVSDLCAVKPHVLRYWEQEFPQLKPVKRRGNRRYYQRQDVLIIRQIRSLLYDEGFTIGGARQRLTGSNPLRIWYMSVVNLEAAAANRNSPTGVKLWGYTGYVRLFGTWHCFNSPGCRKLGAGFARSGPKVSPIELA